MRLEDNSDQLYGRHIAQKQVREGVFSVKKIPGKTESVLKAWDSEVWRCGKDRKFPMLSELGSHMAFERKMGFIRNARRSHWDTLNNQWANTGVNTSLCSLEKILVASVIESGRTVGRSPWKCGWAEVVQINLVKVVSEQRRQGWD